MEDKRADIIKYFSTFVFDDKYLQNLDIINKVWSLVCEGKEFIAETGEEYHHIGNYYQTKKDYVKMRENYNKGISLGFVQSMENLAEYYRCVEKDYEQMKKYYLMAIDRGLVYSMHSLAFYYQVVEKDYEQMKKYYLMAIDKGFVNSMYNLASFYQVKDYEQMKKYYLMAIEKGSIAAIRNLAFYYQYVMGDYDQMEKYFLMGIEAGDDTCAFNMGEYHKFITKNCEQMKKYYMIAADKGSNVAVQYLKKYYDDKNACLADKMAFYYKYMKLSDLELDYDKFVLDKAAMDFIISFDPQLTGLPENHVLILLHKALKSKIDLLDLHFKYSPDGTGFERAKKDFYSAIQPF